MKEYRRIVRRVWSSALAMAVIAGSSTTAFAQSHDSHIQQVGLFGRLFGNFGGHGGHGYHHKSAAPHCDDCDSYIVVSPDAKPSEPAEPSDEDAPAQPEALDASAFDMAADFGVAAATGFSAPNMIGDMSPFNGLYTSPSFVQHRVARRHKVADNTSPIPRSRVYYNYNYFNDIFESGGDLHRNNFGAELAFLDNRASVEIRQSINSFRRNDFGLNGTEAGNLVAVFKGVLFQNNEALISSGVSIGFPVGPTPDGFPGGNGIIAPFIGYYFQPVDSVAFVHGFQQVDIPTDSQDQALMHTDIGAGFWLYQSCCANDLITGIAPTVELHLYTPLGDSPSGSLAGLAYDDVLNITGGVTFVMRDNATLALAVGGPLTDRRDYDVEAQLQFNLFFGGSRRGGYALLP